METQVGLSARDQFNAANSTINITNTYTQYHESETPSTELPAEQDTRHGVGRSPVAVVVVALAVAAFLVWPSEAAGGFPSTDGPWPAGATADAILAAVEESWTECSKAVVLAPANCPQEADSVGSQSVQGVQWLLHGDPVAGAIVRFGSDDQRFHVLGTAVLTATYRDGRRAGFATQSLYYWAKLSWDGIKPAMDDLEHYQSASKWTIMKPDPGKTWKEVAPALHQAFQGCLSSGIYPMPPRCPNPSGATGDYRAVWRGEGDPTLNARLTYDPTFGVLHVRGSYAATADYDWLLGHQTISESGDYDATLSVDNGQVVVIQVSAA